MPETDKPRDEMHFSYLTEEYAEQAVKLMTMSFVFYNDIWKKLKVSKEEGESIMKCRVAYAIEKPWSTMLVNKETRQLISVQTTYDLYDHMHHKLKLPFHAEWMDAIGEVAAELENDYFQSLKPRRGEYLYGDSSATNPKLASRKATQIFWSESMAHFKACGYKALFIRSTNPRSTKLMLNLGGKELKKISMRREELKGEFAALVRIDFKNLTVKSLSELY